MTTRFIPYTNKLSKLIRAPGGKTVGAAVADADSNLRAIEPFNTAGVDAALAEVRAAARGADGVKAAKRIYDAANEIVGLAGLVGLADLGRAAHSLCELIDVSGDDLTGRRDAVDVHVDALRLLRLGEDLPAAERQAVLDGLEDVVERASRS